MKTNISNSSIHYFTFTFVLFQEFKLALIQLAVGSNKADNLRRACQLVREAANQGANLITLPECFNSPYGTGILKDSIDSDTQTHFSLFYKCYCC